MTFRDQRPRCPSCAEDHALVSSRDGSRGSHLVCEHCKGTLVPAAEVEDMLSSLLVEPFALPAGTAGERTCPCCAAKLARLDLFGIEVDRCDAHGVWFDGKELTLVLEAASGIDPKTIETATPAKRSAFGLIKSLFGSRHGLPGQPRRPADDD